MVKKLYIEYSDTGRFKNISFAVFGTMTFQEGARYIDFFNTRTECAFYFSSCVNTFVKVYGN